MKYGEKIEEEEKLGKFNYVGKQRVNECNE